MIKVMNSPKVLPEKLGIRVVYDVSGNKGSYYQLLSVISIWVAGEVKGRGLMS